VVFFLFAFATYFARAQPSGATQTLNIHDFREKISSHEMAVVGFYTKHAKYYPLLQSIFANLTEVYKTNDQLLVAVVDVDENTELTTYTDFNMVDVMIFYPEFILNPLRFSQNLTVSTLREEIDYCWQYSNKELASWPSIPDMVQSFMRASFHGKGNATQIAESAATYLEKIRTYNEIFQNATKDPSVVAVESNKLRLELLNMRRIDLNRAPQDFLDKKRLVHFYDHLLKGLFGKKKMPKIRQTRQFETVKKKRKKISCTSDEDETYLE